VTIDIHADKKRLHFSVRNSLHGRKDSPREEARGMGLRNARRRLELLYGDKHDLSIESRDGEYSISLVLELQGD
jgi:LytS/YehU family sensor histidine kinase